MYIYIYNIFENMNGYHTFTAMTPVNLRIAL